MRLRQHNSSLLGLLLLSRCALTVALATPSSNNPVPVPVADLASEAIDIDPSSVPVPKRRTSSDDAPIDGKDGRPHQGPFVETSGEKADGLGQKPSSSYSSSDSDNAETSNFKDRPADPTVDEYGNKIPKSNDGVMDDKERSRAKEGTTGMEGGVSERERQRKAEEARTGEKSEGSPITPEEKPPLPHSEEEKIQKAEGIKPGLSDEDEKTKTKELGDHDSVGLEKPEDLPAIPHENSQPIPGSASKHFDHLDPNPETMLSGNPSAPVTGSDDEESGVITPFHSFFLSFTMIIFSEIGDKTFLVAALMAMKHDRIVVFTAALSALVAMTVLSAVLGHAVPTLIPKTLTNFAAAALFFVFGVKLLREGLAMSPDEGVAEEMHEVEREISEKESRNGTSAHAMESGYAWGSNNRRKSRSKSRLGSPPRSPSSSPDGHYPGRGKKDGSGGVKGTLDGMQNLTSLLLSPAWVQTFIMTFLGEWGDRSQIATIAMAAGQDYWWVTLGAIIGHACCTGVAVIGGRAIAGKVSMRVVTIGGALAFLVFGLIYLIEGIYT